MRRLWLRWALLIIFVAVLGIVFVNLGEWQLDRLAQRRERNATTIANEQKPIRPYEEIFTRTITDADQWQRVEARGTFDADHQFVVRYRSNGDADGYEIVTPLHTATGTVLVDRGFIPRGTRRSDPVNSPGAASRRGDVGRTRTPQREGSTGRDYARQQSDAFDQLRCHRGYAALSRFLRATSAC